jgi:hypothetical protein
MSRLELRTVGVVVLAAVLAAVSAAGASAAATTTTINEVVPFSTVFDNPCTGEPVTLTGNLHVLIHITDNGAGGFVAKEHFQPQGVTGVGATGTEYQGTGVTQDETASNPGPQFEMTFINNFRIISHGPSPNFAAHDTVHVTFNNNGDLTATVVNSSVECQG